MAYLYQYEDNYCSEEDSDYVPSESSSESETESDLNSETESDLNSETESDFDTELSLESDENSDLDIKEIEYKDMGMPTHVRIYGGKKTLSNNKQTIPSVNRGTNDTNVSCETPVTCVKRVRKAPVRYPA